MTKWWRLERHPPAEWESFEWFTGPPPRKGSSALEQLRFVRRICGRSMLFYVPILAVVLGFGTPEWMAIAIGALLLASVANLLSLTRKIRRAERVQGESR